MNDCDCKTTGHTCVKYSLHPPQPSPATIDIDDILETLEMKANNYGLATKATPDHVVAEAAAQIQNLITEKENRARAEGELDGLYGIWNTQFDTNRTPAQILMVIDNKIRELEATLTSKGKHE